MTAQLDAVVIGAGHNGLTAATYLAAAGLEVLVLERRGVVGGAAVTEEFQAGFRNSSCAYVVSLLRPEVVRDLDLPAHGYAVAPITTTFHPKPDGRYLLLTGEEAHDRAEVARFSNRDFEARQRFDAVLTAAAEAVGRQMLKTPPRLKDGGLRGVAALARMGLDFRRLAPELRHRFLQLMTTSVGDLLDRYFESDAVKITYASSAIAGSLASLYQPGTAIPLLHLRLGEVDGEKGAWGFVLGGMGAITEAMAAAARARGATVRVDAAVAEILVKDGVAGGVRLEDGEEVRARVVLSNADPKRTFLTLLDCAHLDGEFLADIRAYRCESGSLRMSLALAELPDFTCLPGKEPGPQHKGFIVMCPSIAAIERAYEAARRGEWPDEPIVKVLLPSLVDDSLAPPGKHVATVFCQHFPRHLSRSRSWDDHKEEVADLIVETIARYAPNVKRAVLGRQVLSPLDLERDYGLTGGDVFHGKLELDQLFSLRPHALAADYRTPIKGLYLCGSGTHPGGGVTGAPGHNAAREVLRDLKVR